MIYTFVVLDKQKCFKSVLRLLASATTSASDQGCDGSDCDLLLNGSRWNLLPKLPQPDQHGQRPLKFPIQMDLVAGRHL